MKFMMLMIPAVYRGNKTLDPGFVPDPKKVEEMGRFNDEMAKSVKILSLNGLHPLGKGARVSFGKGKPVVTDGPFIETKEVLGGYWMIEAPSKEEVVNGRSVAQRRRAMSSRSGRFLRPRISRYKNKGASGTIFVRGYIEEQYSRGVTEKEQHDSMDACFAYERRHSSLTLARPPPFG